MSQQHLLLFDFISSILLYNYYCINLLEISTQSSKKQKVKIWQERRKMTTSKRFYGLNITVHDLTWRDTLIQSRTYVEDISCWKKTKKKKNLETTTHQMELWMKLGPMLRQEPLNKERWQGAGGRCLKVTEVPAGTLVNRCTDALLAMLMKSLVPGSWMRVSP